MTLDIEIKQARESLHAGDLDTAFAHYETVLANGTNHRLSLEYAFALWQCYEYQRANELFNDLIVDPKTDIPTLQSIAKAYFQSGRFGRAAEVMSSAADRDTLMNVALLVQFAACLERSNQIDHAIEVSERALAIDSANGKAVRQLAHIDKRNGAYAAAVDRIRSHLSSFPDGPNWELRYELAASLDRLGEYDRAWQELVTAKSQLASQTKPDLAFSYHVRQRQADFIQRVTDADLKRWHRTSVEDPSPHRLALLAGFPRSGTTLLEQILTSHPAVVGTDETGILTSQFISPLVWQATDAFEALIEVRGFDDEQIQSGRQAYRKFTSAVIGEPIGERLLIEKDPLLTCDLIIPLRLFPEASIIMPLRDPRDVVISYFSTMVPLGWNSSPSTNIVESARFYHDVMRHWLLLRNRLPWPCLETRYEDLVADQVAETTRLTDFLSLRFEKSMLDVKQRSTEKAVRTPTYDDVTKPIYHRSVGRWKNYEKHLEPAMDILNPYAKEFGYN